MTKLSWSTQHKRKIDHKSNHPSKYVETLNLSFESEFHKLEICSTALYLVYNLWESLGNLQKWKFLKHMRDDSESWGLREV